MTTLRLILRIRNAASQYTVAATAIQTQTVLLTSLSMLTGHLMRVAGFLSRSLNSKWLNSDEAPAEFIVTNGTGQQQRRQLDQVKKGTSWTLISLQSHNQGYNSWVLLLFSLHTNLVCSLVPC